MSKLYKFKKLRPVEVLLVVFVCLFLLAVVPLACRRNRTDAFRIDCGKNLSVIGKAMLMYANDYEYELPRAGGRGGTWVTRIPNWLAPNRFGAYGLAADGTSGKATISSCLYLLVKYGGLTPKSFVCKGDSRTTKFKPADYNAGNRELIELWDFGNDQTWGASKHCSYSYHQPFGLYALTLSSEPGMAVAADRNPWIASPAKNPPKTMQGPPQYSPSSGREAVKVGNAIAHQEDGQNVLFLTLQVNFEKRPFCGINDDNIYTHWDDGDIRIGTPPQLGSEPSFTLDSLLVHDQQPRPPGLRPRFERSRRGRR